MQPVRDETELIRDAVAGDRQAFGELVLAKRERVVRTAYQITGNLDDALDVAQGVFLKLWQSLDRYDPRRKFDTWLYRVTSNAAIDFLRSRGPKGMIQPLPDDEPEIEAAPETPPESRLDGRALQQAFQRLAGSLGEKQRAVFVLREIEGRPTSEIARILNVTESTVRNHLHQARRSLRNGLRRDYPGLLPDDRQ